MTRGENFIEKASCKNKHCSSMSSSAWCDLNIKGDIIKLHDNCSNPKCNFHKIISLTPHQYMLEGGSIKPKLQKNFGGIQTAWKNFLKPAVIVAAPFIGMAVSAKTKNPKVGQATTNMLKSISGVTFHR